MKILIYTDVHFCEYAGILRSHGEKYSTRLENLITSVNWAENLAIEKQCDQIFCLGDFFDKPDLNSREITALNDIKWADMPHTFLVGNHDASSKNLEYNSVNSLKKLGFTIINSPTLFHIEKCDILLLPYILDSDRKSIKEYFDDFYRDSLFRVFPPRIVFSHNDIKNLRYGKFESKTGISIDDIEKNCSLFLNGHLHNSDTTPFAKHAFNLGNLTGLNFSEDSFTYSHNAYILDLAKRTLVPVENPFSLNFYKIDIITENDLTLFDKIKQNAILSVKCPQIFKENICNILNASSNVLDKRVNYSYEQIADSLAGEEIPIKLNQDYLNKFINFCLSNMENTEILNDELQEICK